MPMPFGLATLLLLMQMLQSQGRCPRGLRGCQRTYLALMSSAAIAIASKSFPGMEGRLLYPFPCFSVSPSCRTTHSIIDLDEQVVSILVGQPWDTAYKSWHGVCKEAYKALQIAASKAKPRKSGIYGEQHRISVGIAHRFSLGPGLKV